MLWRNDHLKKFKLGFDHELISLFRCLTSFKNKCEQDVVRVIVRIWTFVEFIRLFKIFFYKFPKNFCFSCLQLFGNLNWAFYQTFISKPSRALRGSFQRCYDSVMCSLGDYRFPANFNYHIEDFNGHVLPVWCAFSLSRSECLRKLSRFVDIYELEILYCSLWVVALLCCSTNILLRDTKKEKKVIKLQMMMFLLGIFSNSS